MIIFIAGVAFVITIIYVFLKVGGLGGLGWRSRGIYVRASGSLVPHARRKCQPLIKKKGVRPEVRDMNLIENLTSFFFKRSVEG